MKRYILAFIFCIFYIKQAYAITPLLRTELMRLYPDTRQEQRCDIAAMEIIAQSHKYAPDKAIAYSFAEPIVKGNVLEVPGAAFRSNNHWYHLSFTCVTSDNKLDIKDFTYKVGALVPRGEWNRYYLVP